MAPPPTSWAHRLFKNQPRVRISPRMRASAIKEMKASQPEFADPKQLRQLLALEQQIFDMFGTSSPSSYLLAVSNNTRYRDDWDTAKVYNDPTPQDLEIAREKQKLANMVFVPNVKSRSRPCPNCGLPMITVPRQLRSGDEGMTGKLMCSKKSCNAA